MSLGVPVAAAACEGVVVVIRTAPHRGLVGIAAGPRGAGRIVRRVHHLVHRDIADIVRITWRKFYFDGKLWLIPMSCDTDSD